MCATCPAHHILTMYGDKYKLLKLIIMQFSPTSFYFLCLRFKYFPQRPVLKQPQCWNLERLFPKLRELETSTKKRPGKIGISTVSLLVSSCGYLEAALLYYQNAMKKHEILSKYFGRIQGQDHRILTWFIAQDI